QRGQRHGGDDRQHRQRRAGGGEPVRRQHGTGLGAKALLPDEGAVQLAERRQQAGQGGEAGGAEAGPRLGPPQAQRQYGDGGADDEAGEAVRVFDQEAAARLLPVDQQQAPRLGRPDRVGHADAEAGDDRPQGQQREQRRQRAGGPEAQPAGGKPGGSNQGS